MRVELANSPALDRLPLAGWPASMVVGLVGLLSVALPLAIFLAVAGLQPLTPLVVSLLKGSWAGLVAAIAVYVAYYLIAVRSQPSRV